MSTIQEDRRQRYRLPDCQAGAVPVEPYEPVPRCTSPQFVILNSPMAEKSMEKSSNTGLWLFLFGFCCPLCWFVGACCAGGQTGSERPFRILNIIMTVLAVMGLLGLAIFYITVFAMSVAASTVPLQFPTNNTFNRTM